MLGERLVGGWVGGWVEKEGTYDIAITYDKYYQTPRAWLLGCDEVGGWVGG